VLIQFNDTAQNYPLARIVTYRVAGGVNAPIATMQRYDQTSSGGGFIACSVACGSTAGGGTTQPGYDLVEIYFRDNPMLGLTSSLKESVARHELAHAWGLADHDIGGCDPNYFGLMDRVNIYTTPWTDCDTSQAT
jgi:hypothetical protein